MNRKKDMLFGPRVGKSCRSRQGPLKIQESLSVMTWLGREGEPQVEQMEEEPLHLMNRTPSSSTFKLFSTS